MALEYAIQPERRLVIISGEYSTAGDWLRLARQLGTDRALEPGFNFVRDLRGAHSPPNTAMVLAIFNVVQRFWPSIKPAKGAIVIDSGDDSAAIVAQALADAHRLPIGVFTSFDTALEWLDDVTTAAAPGSAPIV